MCQNTMNMDCMDKTFFFQSVYREFVIDLCYSECSDYETLIKIFMSMFFLDGITKPFQEAVSRYITLLCKNVFSLCGKNLGLHKMTCLNSL